MLLEIKTFKNSILNLNRLNSSSKGLYDYFSHFKKQKHFINTTNKSNLSLEDYLKAKIKIKGPITVAEFMREALSNPINGYYMKNDVFGTKGDFITAPEVSQLFGEMIGVWLLNEFMILSNIYGDDLPNSILITELGPGRGTLMVDILRVWSKKNIARKLYICLVEMSPFLRKIQFKNLCDKIDTEPELYKSYKSKFSDSIEIIWVKEITEIPKKESIHFFLANEFFDALPIQKFQKTSKGYREILVDYVDKDNEFKFVLSPGATVGSKMLNLHPGYVNYDHVEISFEAARIFNSLVKRLKDYNGSIIIIDYGHNGELKDTLRGYKSHNLVNNILKNPGQCDLTADVDFSFIKHLAKCLNVPSYGPVTQSDFLNRLHIKKRFENLIKFCKNEEDILKLKSDLEMLIGANKMGKRFKFISLRKFDFKQAPIGFE